MPPILLQGETGTGKGLFARSIHQRSARARGPFVDLNCAAIPATLLESELFGSERGAFTDARQPRRGLIEAADAGTFFLDEIGLLSEGLQAKLLTVLEAREVRRLGATRARPVDVLVIAATNTDLREAVRQHRFREDLYHRLAVLVFSLPPLRERGDDVLELAEAFLARACTDHGVEPKRLDADARAAIAAYRWPGNVRELANVMDRVALLTEGSTVAAADLELPSATGPVVPTPLKASVDTFTRARLEEALVQAGGNVSAAAERLGVARSTLRYQLERFGLTPGRIGRARRLPRPLAERVLAPPGPLEGERRQLTVLFADFADSARLVAGRDPEETGKLLDPVVDGLAEAVRRHGGTINQIHSDGLMALFGVGEGREDHAAQACYAALAMHETVRRHDERLRRALGSDLRVRVGLHSGEVVLRSIAGETRLDYAATPEPTRVAARVEQAARPGLTLITADTLQLAEGFVEAVPYGSVADGGAPSPLGVFELRALSAARSRLAAAISRGLAPLIGRESETAQLDKVMNSADGGRGQVAALVGEPGVGKSRLTWEVARSARACGWLVLETGCVSAGQAPPYLPLADLLRTYFRIAPRAEPERTRETVTARLRELDERLVQLATPVLAILDVPIDDADWAHRDSGERRRRMLEGARQLILRASQDSPVLVVVDDLQWIDAETQAFLDLLVESLPAARVLLLVNYRPEATHGWSHRSYYTQVRIDPLQGPSAAALVDALMGTEPALDALKKPLLERTQGNPFFLEESVRTLVETGALVGDRGDYRPGHAASSPPVPARVQAVLAARIGRLAPDDRSLLLAASVIGKDVPLAFLELITGRPEEQLRESLARLQSAELLYATRLDPSTEYTFKHALTHEVAYQSLAEDTRRQHHARFARTLEARSAATVAAQPELLAHHFTAAGLLEPAAGYWLRATRRAAARSAQTEALRFGTRGLEAIAGLPESADRDRQELDLRLLLVTPDRVLKDQELLLRRARELGDRLQDVGRLLRLISREWTYCMTLPDLSRGLALAQQYEAMSPPPGQDLRLYRHGLLASPLFHLGRYEESLVHADSGLLAYDRTKHHPGVSDTYVDIGAMCLTYSAHSLWALGYPDHARRRLHEMLVHARTLNHPYSLAWASIHSARRLWMWKDDQADGEEHLAAGMRIATEYGFTNVLSYGAIYRGWLLVRRGQIAEGIALLREGLAAAQATGVGLIRVQHLGLLAEAYGCAGSPDQGLAVLDEAFALAERGGEHLVDALLHGLRGELLAARGADAEAVEASMRRGLEIARAQHAKSLELRVALSLARLWRRHARPVEARDLVAGIYSWFTEGFETPDLKSARALLEELG